MNKSERRVFHRYAVSWVFGYAGWVLLVVEYGLNAALLGVVMFAAGRIWPQVQIHFYGEREGELFDEKPKRKNTRPHDAPIAPESQPMMMTHKYGDVPPPPPAGQNPGHTITHHIP